ncbi:MAG: NAD(P)H-dependent oxidoreductase [Simkania sp.]|nr:NAD(P)H-dependent oxidoreductase [Simkania sp.]
MEKQVKILGIAGSLRKQSYNRGLLQAAVELSPPNCILEIFDLASIPLYNQDDEAQLPKSVLLLKEKIRAANALLIATPEYNYSIPGVLKNTLDWGSRPYGDNAWNNKPVALMGASLAVQGTSRAQYHLRQVFVTLNMHPLNQPELMVGLAQNKFDDTGKLIDLKTREKITELLTALITSAST